MSKIMSLGGDAEAKKSKKANFFTTFEILKFAQSDKVSTIPIQQFTLPEKFVVGFVGVGWWSRPSLGFSFSQAEQ